MIFKSNFSLLLSSINWLDRIKIKIKRLKTLESVFPNRHIWKLFKKSFFEQSRDLVKSFSYRNSWTWNETSDKPKLLNLGWKFPTEFEEESYLSFRGTWSIKSVWIKWT